MNFLGGMFSGMMPSLINAGSSAAAAGIAYKGTQDTNRAAREIAREQMEFQSHMSNTAYQRAVRDMKMAGINPILAAGGGGASTPSGSSAQVGNALGDAVSSAVSASRTIAEVKNLEATNENLKEQNKQIAADTVFKAAQTGVANAQAEAIKNDNAKKYVQNTFWRWGADFVRGFERTGASAFLQNYRRVGGKLEQHFPKAVKTFKETHRKGDYSRAGFSGH